jgi:hypothetical protein
MPAFSAVAKGPAPSESRRQQQEDRVIEVSWETDPRAPCFLIPTGNGSRSGRAWAANSRP